jgi:succinoglycan biosynthesis protein ExoA
MSTDRTRDEIAAFTSAHPDLLVRLVDNPARSIPTALNTALRAAQSGIILRMDSHSQPYPDYVERCVADLESGFGENVGGVWEIIPGANTWIARSIAIAAAHPLAVGDALYRHANRHAYVDTVPFGAFRRELLALVGFFNEDLLTNEDYEFNVRLKQRGGRVWLDPAIRSRYQARATLGALARQYARYGFWKWNMLRCYPGSLRWRQALPPLFSASLFAGALLAIFLPFFRWILALEIGLYLAVLLATAVRVASKHKNGLYIAGLPLAIASMHLAWGTGFLWSIIKGVFTPGPRKRN